MFSVIIPLYNKEISIKHTINSVLNQTFKDFEIIVVDDGSTDNSLRVVKEFDDDRIRLISKTNGGVSSARNRGIEEARNSWIAFLDGDDLWIEDHLETVSNMISKYPNDSVFCTSFVKSSQPLPEKADNTILEISDYFVEAINEHFYWTSVAVINTDIFNRVGNFNSKLVLGEDLDLWARIGRDYRFIKSNRVTAIYKIDAENRACFVKYNYNSSFVSTIELSGKKHSEKRYLRRLLYRRLYSSLTSRRFDMVMSIIKKLV